MSDVVSSPQDQAAPPSQAAPKLICYALNDYAPKIVAARPDRAWMDAQPNRHPYRCLPLAIANSYGWHLLCPTPIEIEWNGGPGVGDLKVRALKPLLPPGRLIETFCRSTFAFGIATMFINYIFQTDPGWDLMATGPANEPNDNAYPLTGVIETSWLPYPFTMNWQVLRPGKVRFEQDEPFCSIFPVRTGALVNCQPEIRNISSNKELAEQANAFRLNRFDFHSRFYSGNAEALKQGWSKQYFQGTLPDGTRAEEHINKLRLNDPEDRR